MIQIGENNFTQEVVHSDMPVAVAFTASWCVPFELMKASFEKASLSYAGIVKFGQIDIEKDRALGNTFHVGSIPAFIFFYKGSALYRAVGYMKEKDLLRFVETGMAKIM